MKVKCAANKCTIKPVEGEKAARESNNDGYHTTNHIAINREYECKVLNEGYYDT